MCFKLDFNKQQKISSSVTTPDRQRTMNVKTFLTAKVMMIQSVSANFNLVSLMATCSQNSLAACFRPLIANWPKHS